jgi:hypothetical protein
VAALLFLVALVPLLYVLSFGPCVGYYYPNECPQWIDNFYVPLGWAMERSQVFEDFLNWYASLWLPDEP